MGSKIAVYDLCSPSEAQVNGRKTVPRRGKRRGRRSGVRLSRRREGLPFIRDKVKRRAMVGSAPPSSFVYPSKPPFSDRFFSDQCFDIVYVGSRVRLLPKGNKALLRKGYCDRRYKDWAMKRVKLILDRIASLNRMKKRSDFLSLVDVYRSRKARLFDMKQSWCRISARKSGDSYFFTRNRLMVVLWSLGAEGECSPLGIPSPSCLTRTKWVPRGTDLTISTEPTFQPESIHHCTHDCDSDCELGVSLPPVIIPYGRSRTAASRARGNRRRERRRISPGPCDCPIPNPTIRGLCVNCSGRVISPRRRT